MNVAAFARCAFPASRVVWGRFLDEERRNANRLRTLAVLVVLGLNFLN